MKKIIILVTLIVTLFSFPVFHFAVAGDEPTSPPATTAEPATTPPYEGLKPDDFNTENEESGFFENASKSQNAITTFLMNSLKYLVVGGDQYLYAYIPTDDIVSMLYKVFFPIGLTIFFITWCVGLAHRAAEGDLFEPTGGGGKGIVKELSTFFAGALLITFSHNFFKLIDAIALQGAAAVFASGGTNNLSAFNNYLNTTFSVPKSNIPIVGFFINILNNLQANALLSVSQFFLMLVTLVITITLGIRTIKLAIFQGFAPVFLGVGFNPDTRRYMINFIAQYCLLSFQIIIIAALLNAFNLTIGAMYAALVSGALTMASVSVMTTGIIVCIIFTIIILKSNRLFERVIN